MSKWDEKRIQEAFGDELVQALNYTSSTFSYFWKSTNVEYLEVGEVFDSMKKQRDFSKIYKTNRSGTTAGARKFVVVDQEMPESLLAEIKEPNVTQ